MSRPREPRPADAEPLVATRYWHALADGRLQCDLCPRACRLAPGQRGLCFNRLSAGGAIVLAGWGMCSGLAVDPVEKKPLYHFLPGSSVLSFGTIGCNLTCRFCQNWDISKARELDRLSFETSPTQIALTATRLHCAAVAFTYNDPVVFHEFAIDVAAACRDRGIPAIAVSAGYVNPAPRAEFYSWMDAVNVDLKSFSDAFYRRMSSARLAPVLDTLRYIRHETTVWLEITTLLIPGENDSDAELDALTGWVADQLGTDVPLHFTAFHPAWRLLDRPSTPLATLQRACRIARRNGIRYAYTGNVADPAGSSTSCARCGALLIRRDGYRITDWQLRDGCCAACGTPLPGRFPLERTA